MKENKMKNKSIRIIVLTAALVMSAAILPGCGKNETTTSTADTSNSESTASVTSVIETGTESAATVQSDGSAQTASVNIGEPAFSEDDPFMMAVEECFTITGRAVVASGTITSGKISKGDQIQVISPTGEMKEAEVLGVEISRKDVDKAVKGDKVGIIFDIDKYERKDFENGSIIIKSNGYQPVQTFTEDITFLTAAQGGRDYEFGSGDYTFNFGTSDYHGKIVLPDGKDKVSSGEKVSASIQLENPQVVDIAKTTGEFDKLSIIEGTSSI